MCHVTNGCTNQLSTPANAQRLTRSEKNLHRTRIVRGVALYPALERILQVC